MSNRTYDDEESSFSAARFAERLFYSDPEWRQYVVRPDLGGRGMGSCSGNPEPFRAEVSAADRDEEQNDRRIVVVLHEHFNSWGGRVAEKRFTRDALAPTIRNRLSGEGGSGSLLGSWRVGGDMVLSKEVDRHISRGGYGTTHNPELIAVSWNGGCDRKKFDPDQNE